jgi:hypothetical protein
MDLKLLILAKALTAVVTNSPIIYNIIYNAV